MCEVAARGERFAAAKARRRASDPGSDSYCRGANSVGAAGAFITSPAGTYSADFVNVTAVTTGTGIGLVVNVQTGNTHNTVVARNTIASSVFVSNIAGATSSASATLSTSKFPSSSTNGGANTSVTPAEHRLDGPGLARR